MPAVLTAMPPGRGLASTIATRLAKYAACAAPFSPAGPAPMTTRSYLVLIRVPGHHGCPLRPETGRAPGAVGSPNIVPRVVAENEHT